MPNIFERLFQRLNHFKQYKTPPPEWSWQTNYMTEAPAMTTQEHLNVYGKVSTVYSCVRIIAQTIAAVNWKIKKNDQEIKDHLALELFKNPVPFLTRWELFYLTVQHLELTGEAMWLLLKNKQNKILGLLPINPTMLQLNINEMNMPEAWEFHGTHGRVTIDLEDVLFFKYPNPINIYRGMSPLQAVAMEVDATYYASQWNKNFFYNSAMPSAGFTFKEKLSDQAYLRLKKQITNNFQGVKNAHKFIILEGGADVKNLQLSQKDMEFLELKKYSREEIASTFGVPLTKLGLNENSNKATAYVNDLTFAKNTITPRLRMIKEVMNKYFLSQFEDGLEFDFESVIPTDEELEIQKNVQYVNANILTVNEVREKLGKKPVKWGDAPLQPLLFSAGEHGKQVITKKVDHEAYWKDLTSKKSKDEIYFQGWVTNRFTKQEKQVIENLRNIKSIGKAISKQEAEKMADEILNFLLGDEELEAWQGKYEDVFTKLSKEELDDFVSRFGIDVNFTEADGAVLWKLTENKQRFAKQINTTTYTQLKNSLIEGFFNGEGEKEMAKRVEEIMTLSKRQRSATIARTETFGVVNMVHDEAMKHGNVQYKQWYTALDERVRPDHMAAHGQIVKVTDEFRVGGDLLQYPGDPNGRPENVINCRCVSVPYISEVNA